MNSPHWWNGSRRPEGVVRGDGDEHADGGKSDPKRLFGEMRKAWRRFRRVDTAEEAVAPPRNGLDEARVVRIISQRIAQPFDGGVKAVVEIAEVAAWPKFAAKFLPGNHLAGMLEQHAQDLERLFL